MIISWRLGSSSQVKKWGSRELADLFLTYNNDVYQNVPAVWTVTRTFVGNFHSTWASSGGYAPIAKELLGEEPLMLTTEFDTDRAGGFEPLRSNPW